MSKNLSRPSHLLWAVALLVVARPPFAAAQLREAVTPEKPEVVLTLGDPNKQWDVIRHVAYNHAGTVLAVCADDGIVQLRDVRTNALIKELKAKANFQLSVSAQQAVFSPDDALLAVATSDKLIRVWDLKSGDIKQIFAGHRDGIIAVAFSPDGKTLASAADDKAVRVWDLVKPIPVPGQKKVDKLGFVGPIPGVTEQLIQPLREFADHGEFLSALDWSPDGSTLAVGLWNGSVELWDAKTGAVGARLEGHSVRVGSVAFSRDGKRLVTAGLDGSVRLWNVAEKRSERVLREHVGPVLRAEFNPAGDLFASAGCDGQVILWHAATGTPLTRVKGHKKEVTALTFSRDGRTLTTAGTDGDVIHWRLDGTLLRAADADRAAFTAAVLSADGATVLTGDDAGRAVLWDASTGQRRREFVAPRQILHAVAISASGRIVAAGGDKGLVHVWRADGGGTQTLSGHRDAVLGIGFSPDGARLVSASADKTLILWDLLDGHAVHTFTGHTGVITSVAFTPGGSHLVSVADDRTIKVWDAASGQVARDIPPDEDDDAVAVAVRPDGKQIATVGNRDFTVKLFDPVTGGLQRSMTGHRGQATSAAYSPDGRLLATAAPDGTVRFWDTSTGKVLRIFTVHAPRGAVTQVSFSGDGGRIATVNGNGTVTVIRTAAKPGIPERSTSASPGTRTLTRMTPPTAGRTSGRNGA